MVRPANKPITKTGGVVGLKGNLAPEGAIVKVAGMERAEVHRPGALLRRRGSLLRGGQEQASTRKATCSSSATRAPRAAPACARCWRPPPRSTARAWAARSRSSPTAASPARRAASASAMSARRRRSAARSRWSATATSSRSTPTTARIERQAVGRRTRQARKRLEAARERMSAPAISGNTPSRSGSALHGAVTHPGGAAEKSCYADI